MRAILIFSLVLAFSCAAAPSSERLSETGLFSLVRESDGKETLPPLLILLHGLGSNEEDLFSFASEIPENFLVVSLRAPHRVGEKAYRWYRVDFLPEGIRVDDAEEVSSRNAIRAFIDDLATKKKFDKSRIYVCGFSQGAILSLNMAMSDPGFLQGIAVMSGRLMDNFKVFHPGEYPDKSLRVFISHGTSDKLLPVEGARTCRDYLTEIGLSPDYHEYPMAHSISPAALSDLIFWLKKA